MSGFRSILGSEKSFASTALEPAESGHHLDVRGFLSCGVSNGKRKWLKGGYARSASVV